MAQFSPEDGGAATTQLAAPGRAVRLLLTCGDGEEETQRVLAFFATIEEAMEVARAYVDRQLANRYQRGCTGRELYQTYFSSGADIYVDAALGEPVFQGWQYAQKRCRELCGSW